MNTLGLTPSNRAHGPSLTFMKTLSAALLLPWLLVSLQAAPIDLGTVKLRDGRKLEEVKVMKIEPDGLRLEHREGVGKVRMEDLPSAVAERFSLDEATASAWRMAEKKRLDAEADSRRRAQVRVLMESSRDGQDAQARATRMSIFDQAKASNVNYAALDDQLLTQIQLWKEADRDDLAARFEEDRSVLKQQEIARPSTALESEKQALARRVESLQSEVNQANNRPTTTTVVIDSDRTRRSSYDPYHSGYYQTPTYYVPTPVVVHPTPWCPPIHQPKPAPIVRPHIVVPRPSNMGNPIHGSHLWKK